MPRTRIVLIAATVLLLGASSDVEKTVLAFEKQWSAANVRKDVAALQRIMADDYVGIESIGVVQTRAQEIEDIRTGDVVVDAEQPTQMKVRLYGSVAVVTGHLSIRDIREGKAGQHEVAFTDIWVRNGGRWQVVNYQATQLKDAQSHR